MNKEKENKWIWWKHGVIYHIYPRSFYDSDNDGIGDIKGIICKLDYLVHLGIDAIWLSPIYQSPNKDYGYDVSDYTSINPEYGTLEDFKNLLKIAHSKNIKVIMDMIMNHTSDQHPWFLESKSSIDNPKRDWYIWKTATKGKSPNNWKSSFGNTAWQLDEKTNAYYLHSFFKEQPDLNWRNKEMQHVFFEEIKYWLELGVDGFRLDVINMIVKDKKYRNNPLNLNIPFLQLHKYSRNRPKSYEIVKKLRKLIDKYDESVLIGEIYVMPPGNSKLSASYLADGKKGIHLAFDFSLLFQKWNATIFYKCIQKWNASIPDGGWPCYVFSNHDLKRSINRNPLRKFQLEKAKIEAVLLLTLKGTPFIYYGEEIGMKNARIPYRNIKDSLGKKYWPIYNGRDGARTPMQWNTDAYAGFSMVKPWLPVHSDYKKVNVQFQENETDSLFNIYQSLILLRKKYSSLNKGEFSILKKGKDDIFAYSRIYQDEIICIFMNFSSHEKIVQLKEIGEFEILFSSQSSVKEHFIENKLILSPFEAFIYKLNVS
ncbi:MAG: glycoside hydrolase family 13 protein [Bacteroidales bacterium]